MRRHVCALAVVIAVILAFVPRPAHAQRSLDILSFDADYVVTKGGRLDVTERITANFSGQWNGLYRMIPVRYKMPTGTDYLISVDILDARDEAGHVLKREQSREGSYLKIKAWIPDANNAAHTLILRYSVDDALRFFDEHDELYWNVTGNGWDYPIQSVTAHVTLPDGATGVRTAAYTGLEGATSGDAVATHDDHSATFTASRPLQLHEGMTIVTGWAPGLVTRPGKLEKAAHGIASNAFLLIPFLVLLIMYMIWRKYGRDPDVGTITPRYEPPTGITPAEAGTVIDMSVDNRDISATFVDLAVRGHIRIHEMPRHEILGMSLGTEYTVERLTPAADQAALAEHERLMLKGLFAEHPDLVSVDSLRNKFYVTLGEIKTSLTRGMMNAGYLKQDPSTVRTVYLVAAVVIGWIVMHLGQFLAARHGFDESTIMFAAISTGVTIAAFGYFMPRRTVRGIQIVRQVLGFEEFLSRVEGDRMRTVIDRPELFEKYLPYAIALGVDQQWAKRFEGLTLPPPQWYTGYNGTFHSNTFAHSVGRMTSSVSTSFSSSPRSSGGSGFSGGSSGGGFGGGGGGGF